jgi:hypothetical protein
VNNIFGLRGDAEFILDVVFLEVFVEAAAPDIAQEDVGGLENRADFAWVGRRQHDGFGA